MLINNKMLINSKMVKEDRLHLKITNKMVK